jgi:hypothetical protein
MRPVVSAGWPVLEGAIMGLQISTRESDDVTVLDLTGRVMAGSDSDLLSPHLQKFVAKGASELLLNLKLVHLLDLIPTFG